MAELTSARVTHLVSELAALTGEDAETALVCALEERLARVTPQPGVAKDAEIDALFECLAQMPVLDPRSPDEIGGYGPNGLPQ